MKPEVKKHVFKSILESIAIGLISFALILGLLYVAYLTGITKDFLIY